VLPRTAIRAGSMHLQNMPGRKAPRRQGESIMARTHSNIAAPLLTFTVWMASFAWILVHFG
jgi:hypothetical protein